MFKLLIIMVLFHCKNLPGTWFKFLSIPLKRKVLNFITLASLITHFSALYLLVLTSTKLPLYSSSNVTSRSITMSPPRGISRSLFPPPPPKKLKSPKKLKTSKKLFTYWKITKQQPGPGNCYKAIFKKQKIWYTGYLYIHILRQTRRVTVYLENGSPPTSPLLKPSSPWLS